MKKSPKLHLNKETVRRLGRTLHERMPLFAVPPDTHQESICLSCTCPQDTCI